MTSGPLFLGNTFLLGDTSTALQYVFGPILFLVSLFLILLVLVQRGRGGGLAGALGGMGGQSAFGSKAGDVFTRITVVVASIWFLLCCLAIACLNRQHRVLPPETPSLTSPEQPGPSSDSEATKKSGESSSETDSAETESDGSKAAPAADETKAGDEKKASAAPSEPAKSSDGDEANDGDSSGE